MRRQINLSTEHIKRDDNFRYEKFFDVELDALDNAKERTLKTNKSVFVMKDVNDKFQTNAHGVELIGWTSIAEFKKGKKIK